MVSCSLSTRMEKPIITISSRMANAFTGGYKAVSTRYYTDDKNVIKKASDTKQYQYYFQEQRSGLYKGIISSLYIQTRKLISIISRQMDVPLRADGKMPVVKDIILIHRGMVIQVGRR